nr:FERM domain containing protein 5 [Hymenolepis microstoma]
MAAASSRQLSVDLAPDDHKRSSIRKGSIFNLFNLSSNERLNEATDVDIQLFDGTKMCALVDYRISCKMLIERIASELGGLSMAKYLGLIIEPPGELPEWMDLNSLIAKEKTAKGFNIIMVRIKFYPADPVLEMKPDFFLNLLYFQLRHDLAVGRLLGKDRDRCLLVSYSIIYEHGLKGICKDQLPDNVEVRSTVYPHQLDNSMQNQIKEYLEENYEISEEEALNFFLKVATRMDTYGIEPFDAKDQRGNGIAVGFNFRGLSVFKSSQQVNFFRWESMISYECDRRNVVITIKTRDAKKKIGFKCDSRASAMQLCRRLREASNFFSPENVENKSDTDKPPKFANPTFTKSTESMNSDSSNPSNNHACQITRIKSLMPPPRLFSLSLSGDSAKSSLNLTSPFCGGISSASTPTNQPDHSLPIPPRVQVVLLNTPEIDDGSKTPTPSHHGDSATDHSDISATKHRVAITNRDLFEGESNEYSLEHDGQYGNAIGDKGKERPKLEVEAGSSKAEQLKEEEDEKKLNSILEGKNPSTGEEIEKKESVVTILVEESKDDSKDMNEQEQGSLSKLKSSLDFSSQESLLKYNSPFGDFAKSNLFQENNRNRLGVMDFEISASTSSITIPTSGNAVSQTAQPPSHFFPRRRSKIN